MKRDQGRRVQNQPSAERATGMPRTIVENSPGSLRIGGVVASTVLRRPRASRHSSGLRFCFTACPHTGAAYRLVLPLQEQFLD